VAGRYEARADCDPHPAYPDRARARGGHRLGNSMQQWARSVWLGQCAAAGNAHFRLAKVVEPRRYPARSLTRFARRRGPTRLLPALAPHRVPRNHCEESVPLVLPNGHSTHPSVHGVRVSHSHEKQAPEPGSRQPSRRGARLSATGIRNHRYEIKSFPMPPLARDVMIADLLGTLARPEDYVRGVLENLYACLSQRSGNQKGRFICAYRSHRPRYRTPLPN
jgi:hypothetical protein